MLQTWIKIFFRNSKKNWLNLVVNISGLTLGFAGLLIVLLYFNDELSYNDWNPNKDEIYRVANTSRNNGIWFSSTSAEAILFKSDIPEVEETVLVSPFYRSRVLLNGETKVYTEKMTQTEPNFFDFFPFTILEGTTAKFAENRTHIALSKEFAKKLYGNKSPIGELVKIDGNDHIITCVYEVPGNSHYESELLMQFSKPFELHWGNFQNELFCKITKDANIDEVRQKMNNVIIERNVKPQLAKNNMTLEEVKEKYGIIEVLLEQLSTIRLHHKANHAGPGGKGNYQLLLVLLGLSILLIIISCVNFINLSTASASQRAKEVGVKKTLGLSKKQLIFQYVFEIVLQGFIALLFALILVEFVLPYFNQFMDKNIRLTNGGVLLKLIGIAIATSITVGSIPALYLANFKTVEVLKGNFSRSKKGIIARNVMLGLQFLISGFFLIGVLVIYNQMAFMIHKDLGFEKAQTLVVDVYNIEDEYKKYELLKSSMIHHENIMEISSSMFVPGDGNLNGTSLRYGDESFNTASNTIDHNYIDFAQLNLLKGRTFSEKFASDTISTIMLNETAAKRLGIYNDPIGKEVNLGWQPDEDKRKFEVIGMIQDYHFDGFDVKIDPMFLIHWKTFPMTKKWLSAIQFKIKPENISQTIADIEEFWIENVDDKYPFNYQFLDAHFAETYEKYEKQQTMFLILSTIVIIISLLGLFALATLTIQQRLKEVAIRKTLGASVKEIMFQLVKSFLKITIIAVVVLLPISYYFMQGWLDNFVYRIDMPLWPYIVTPVILLILVFVVVGVKAFNATKIDLIKYLKFE
ncbi:macrolide export ATP-binding/permease protein MacB [Kordia sp. SMS9]|uniref:ABC transporter permease n=1 Tax=Kordia sp. SMS9 TaxID=2282170 RepID=UPI000E0D570E|nr:ABC transporter permease [Kordia sp. SMS9]AXG70407.1 macrolide export ATP-binding/permease protein MacB [Kordia sp. SMS9]